MNGVAIIHIPGISLNPQDFFEIMVKRTRQQQSICLTDLTAQAKPYRAKICNEAVV